MGSSLPLSTPSVLYLHLRLSKDTQQPFSQRQELKIAWGVELGVNGSDWKRGMRRKRGKWGGGGVLKKCEREAKETVRGGEKKIIKGEQRANVIHRQRSFYPYMYVVCATDIARQLLELKAS